MAQLAILGHKTRGNEVIEILEMLGGKNDCNYGCNVTSYIYSIDEKGTINWYIPHPDSLLAIFTLEEFLEKFPYKVGDKVKVCGDNLGVIISMRWETDYVVYKVKLSKNGYETSKTSENLQPYKEETMKEKSIEQITLDIPNGYEFFGIDDNNKIVLTKKQPQYPKTYEECCDILEYPHNVVGGYKAELLSSFQNLLICRDVYWKIAGWNPKIKGERFYMNSLPSYLRGVFPMPTEEMCDAFSENFEDLIETCKELLEI